MAKAEQKNDNKTVSRAPIVTILGHVDHGKTTILDHIRGAHVQADEVGGITQKTSVFTVKHGEVAGGKQEGEITFIDTPGHEAFDLMRTRGGSIADVVLLIIAADDGVMPQTKESIEVIKSSSAKPIVVINKVDLPNINIEKIKRDLVANDILVEGMGGAIPVAEVSGKTGKGIPELLDTINLVIEMEGLTDRGELPVGVLGKGFILESVKDKSKGYVSSMVVTQGDFNKGGWIVYKNKAGMQVEKIKGFVSEAGVNIADLASGHGGKIIGVSNLIELGAEILSIESNDRKLVSSLESYFKVEELPVIVVDEVESAEDPEATPDWFNQMFSVQEVNDEGEEIKKLNVILKSSSEGSLEALVKTVNKISVEGYAVNIVESGVGDITQKDIDMASVTKSIILGFEVAVDSKTEASAREKGVLLRSYDLIYKLTGEIEDALTIMATPRDTEEELGFAVIKAVFTLSNGDVVLGGRVSGGIMKLGAKCYIVRNDEIVGEGRIKSLRNQKSEIKEAQKGADFGAILDPKVPAEEGDEIHCFKIVK